ncbi:unnamed protein product, partial [Allacma fusca]
KTFVKESILGIEPAVKGVNHGGDMFFYFAMEEMGLLINEENKLYQYSKDLVKMIAQFAHAE